eukprot:TRINITY_DN7116_c1_g1_i1.p2 TRINITY_DN7116_c1_g1~~TRINITY_DN7116_c1_g1_i1.p2  ORF type:complete len:63 (+),score=7.07 TRINITY_DN7116_c1_g1_i1:357-545(+)
MNNTFHWSICLQMFTDYVLSDVQSEKFIKIFSDCGHLEIFVKNLCIVVKHYNDYSHVTCPHI